MNTPTAQELLQHTTWMRGLARTLVRDEGKAEDAVQQALLRALERPPRERRALPAWLARVTRNEALGSRRRDSARDRRERASARPEAAEPTADVVARAEMHRVVVAEVLALDEPYRTALLLRWFEALEPKAIAERMNANPATVRSHLHRGLERLRERLDERHEGDRRRWAVGLVPFFADRAEAGTTLVPLVAARGLPVVALALLVATGLGAAWWAVQQASEETSPGERTEHADARQGPALAGAPSIGRERSAVPDGPLARPGELRIVAEEAERAGGAGGSVGEAPLPGAHVKVVHADGTV